MKTHGFFASSDKLMCIPLILESLWEESVHPAFPQGNRMAYNANFVRFFLTEQL